MAPLWRCWGPTRWNPQTLKKACRGCWRLENGEVTAGEIRFKGRSLKEVSTENLVRGCLFHWMEGRRVFEGSGPLRENLVLPATYALSERKNSLNGFLRVSFTIISPSSGTAGKQLARFTCFWRRRNRCWRLAVALIAQPELIMLVWNRPWALAPQACGEKFTIIARINERAGHSNIAWWNRIAAVSLADCVLWLTSWKRKIVIDALRIGLAKLNRTYRNSYLGLEARGEVSQFTGTSSTTNAAAVAIMTKPAGS